jgi:hypothetical protein
VKKVEGDAEIFIIGASSGATGINITNNDNDDSDPDWSPALETSAPAPAPEGVVLLIALPLIGYSLIEGLLRRRRT